METEGLGMGWLESCAASSRNENEGGAGSGSFFSQVHELDQQLEREFLFLFLIFSAKLTPLHWTVTESGPFLLQSDTDPYTVTYKGTVPEMGNSFLCS